LLPGDDIEFRCRRGRVPLSPGLFPAGILTHQLISYLIILLFN